MPRTNRSHYFHDEEEEAEYRKHIKPGPREAPTPPPLWETCTADKWTKMLEAATAADPHHPDKVIDVLLLFARCASSETTKTKLEFSKFASEKLGDQDIEKSLGDYRQCVIPIYIADFYENMNKYEVYLATNYGFICTLFYFHCFQFMVQGGCTYNKALLEQVKLAETYCHDMACLLNRTRKYFNMPLGFAGKIETPDYLTKNTGDNILFIRDFIIMRDFNDFCNRLAMALAFHKRKLYLHSGLA